MNAKDVYEEVGRLTGRSWSSFSELYGAVRRVVDKKVTFDCFEEIQPGVVVVRKRSVGKEDEGFSFRIQLQSAALAA